MAIYYYRLIKKRREELGDDLLSKLIESEIETRGRRIDRSTTSRSPIRNASGARAPRR